MNATTHTLRKRASLYAKSLACILFTGLAFYAISPLVKIPEFLYMLFPVWIWGKIAITNGATYLVVSSICLLMVCTVPLFIWGHGYPKKEHYAMRLKIWLILFQLLLAYTLMIAAVAHIAALPGLHKAPTPPPGVYPMPTEAFDEIISKQANTPPIRSGSFIVFVIVMAFYTTLCIKIQLLLKRVKRSELLVE